MEMSKLLTADYRGELDMVFSFDHLETPGHVRFDDYKYDLNYYKAYMLFIILYINSTLGYIHIQFTYFSDICT